jgi:hypothetical protein
MLVEVRLDGGADRRMEDAIPCIGIARSRTALLPCVTPRSNPWLNLAWGIEA